EIWPNLIYATHKRKILLYLVNARLSKKSWAGYRRIARLTRGSLSRISVVAAQTDDDAQRFEKLGAREVTVTGNLKFDATPPAGQQELGRAWRQLYGPGRRVLLAASTREG